MEPEHFAGRLRELRMAAGLTQQQMAENAGMALRTVTALESGDRKPTWSTVLTLARALGVTCEAFTQEPADVSQRKPGRPRKEEPAKKTPKRRKKE